MGLNPYETEEELFLVKAGIKPAKDLSKNFAVQRGKQLEPLARNIWNKKQGWDYEPMLFEMDNFPHAKYSSDGFLTYHDVRIFKSPRKLIEIKCMQKTNHEKFMDTKKVPAYYMDQCQWGMMIAGADELEFIAYNPKYPNPLEHVTVYPDKLRQSELLYFATKFWNRVCEEKLKLEFELA